MEDPYEGRAAHRTADNMDSGVNRRPWLRLSIAVPVLLVCSLCAAATLRGASTSGRNVELMSAIDEYLQGKYGTGGAQTFGQINSFDHTGYAGTQSVAKEFGLSDNNPLVQEWDQDNTVDSLDDDSSMMGPEAQSAPARAAAITSSVFSDPSHPAHVAAAPSMDPRQAAMAAAGAKAVDSVSMAAERKQMHQQMLQRFEAQAETTTKKVAAQTAVTDTIGDGTVPSDSAYLPLPGTNSASSSAVPALAAAAKAFVKKPAAAAAPATTASAKPKAVHAKAAAKSAAPKPAAAAATAMVAAKKVAPAADKAHKNAKPASEVSYKLHLEEEVKKLEKEVRAKDGHEHTKKAKAALAPAQAQSWSGLANMLDSKTPEEVQAQQAQQKLLTDDSSDDGESDSKPFNFLSDPENDLKDDSSPDGPTGQLSAGDDFGSLLTTLEKDEDPAAAAQEEMYRRAEAAAVNTLHPVQEVYSDTPYVSVMRSQQPVQQLRSVPLNHLHASSGSALLNTAIAKNNAAAIKLKLLKAEVKSFKEQAEIKKLQQEVSIYKAKMTAPTRKAAHSSNSQEAKDLKEDEESMQSVTKPELAAVSKHTHAPAAPKHTHFQTHSDESQAEKESAAAEFEKARAHMAVHEADTSEENVARLRAEVEVMRDRISTLEKKEDVKPAQADAISAMGEQTEDKDKARQQLLSQFRQGALSAGKTSKTFWELQQAREVAAQYKAQALTAGAHNYDQVQILKSQSRVGLYRKGTMSLT